MPIVFARTEDVAGFLRGNVNLGYWSEKVVASDVHGGIRSFEPDIFIAFVLKDSWDRRHEYDTETAARIWAGIRCILLDDSADNRSLADIPSARTLQVNV